MQQGARRPASAASRRRGRLVGGRPRSEVSRLPRSESCADRRWAVGSRLACGAAPRILVGGLVLVLGFDQGGFATSTWVWSAAPLAILAGALVLGQARRPSTIELAFLAALAGLLVWTLVSVAWSLDPTASVLDAERLLLYLATASALVLLARPGSRTGLLVGVLVALTVLCLAGLGDAAVGDDPSGRSPTTLAPRTGSQNLSVTPTAWPYSRDGGAARGGSRSRHPPLPRSLPLLLSAVHRRRCTSPTRVARGLGSRSAYSRSLRRESLRSTAASSSRSARSSSLR